MLFDSKAAMLLFIVEHTVTELKIWPQLKQAHAVFPEESESWRGIDHSLFPLSHTQAHRCSLCCASFTDRHTSIRGELGQRVLAAMFVCDCVHEFVFLSHKDRKRKGKQRDTRNYIVWNCAYVYICLCVLSLTNGKWTISHSAAA